MMDAIFSKLIYKKNKGMKLYHLHIQILELQNIKKKKSQLCNKWHCLLFYAELIYTFIAQTGRGYVLICKQVSMPETKIFIFIRQKRTCNSSMEARTQLMS